ncbi:uncharacterized protein LOC142339845 isoform X2 [Convolutriloba macropyga]|uniref:uncharacterized protein LOC142339845 isoform X2 n=1 Tax=Convolutriloba macropyga TaxID=536237 RepID=UPI003F51F9CF
MTWGILDESQLTIFEYAGLFVSLCALVSGGFSQYKDWFNLPSVSRAPSFSVWSVCYNGDWGNCIDPMSLEQYDYGPAIVSSRIFQLLALVVLLFVCILASGSLWGSQKINSTNPIIFGALCLVAVVFQTLGNSIFEGAVRLRVTRYLTPFGQPRIDSCFGWSGICAWMSFVLTICSTIVYFCYFYFTSRAMAEMEKIEDQYDEREN